MKHMPATLFQMLDLLVEHDASDLHIIAGHPPMVRVNGALIPIQSEQPLTESQAQDIVLQLLTEEQKQRLEQQKTLDFSYQHENKGRFRINAYFQRGSLAAAFRLIPIKIKTIEELGMPSVVHTFSQYHMGLVLVTGPTGSGKSSTLAAIIQEINQSRKGHILTIEDPIEYIYSPAMSTISQREVGQDTPDWNGAMKVAMRQDPNVILVGEMRDLETVAAAITLAETGHLVFATLHTNSGPETVDRIIDIFPQHQQNQVRQQVAAVLRAILAQRLIVTADGSRRVPAVEILIKNSAIANLIREGKTHQLDSVLQTSAGEGMMLLEAHLSTLVSAGVLSYDEARNRSIRPDELDRLLGK
jgi:twitching motility protein PilT